MTDTNDDKPLTERELAALAAYTGPGSGAHACEVAGYTGNRQTLKSRMSKILAKPAAQRWLDARAQQTLAASLPDGDDEGDPSAPLPPRTVLERIAGDETALPSARVRAAELLRREELAAKAADAGPPQTFVDRVNEQIRTMREREHASGCCSRCGQRLPGGAS